MTNLDTQNINKIVHINNDLKQSPPVDIINESSLEKIDIKSQVHQPNNPLPTPIELTNELTNSQPNPNHNPTSLNESSILISNLDIFKFQQPTDKLLNISKNIDDSIQTNIINNMDVSTQSTDKDIKDMVDANLSNHSQMCDGVGDGKGSGKFEDGVEKIGILDSIFNDNDDSYKQNEREDKKVTRKLNISHNSVKSKSSSRKGHVKNLQKKNNEQDADDVDIDEKEANLNRSVMEISLDSIKNNQRIEETLIRKKIPDQIEIKLEENIPKINKHKHTPIMNFITSDIDFKKELSKQLNENGYEQRMIDAYKNDAQDLNSVVKSMEQRLLQFGKLAPIEDIGQDFDGESDSEKNSNYNLKDGWICDETVEQDEFSDEDEKSFVVEFEPKLNFISGDCLEDLVKFNEKCLIKKTKISEKKKRNQEKERIMKEQIEKEKEQERIRQKNFERENREKSKIKKIITLNLDNSVISDDTVNRELLVSQMDLNENRNPTEFNNETDKEHLKTDTYLISLKNSNTTDNCIVSNSDEINNSSKNNSKKSNKQNVNKLDKFGNCQDANVENGMHDVSISSSVVCISNKQTKNDENIDAINPQNKNKEMKRKYVKQKDKNEINDKILYKNENKTISTLGKFNKKLIKDSNKDQNQNCDQVKLDETIDSCNKSGNFNRSFKTKTLKQSQSQISQSSNDPEIKINDVIRKDLEAELNCTNDKINTANKLSNSIIEISGDMLDTNINNHNNLNKKKLNSNNQKTNQDFINSSETKKISKNKKLKKPDTNNISNISIHSQISNSSLKRKRNKNDLNKKESNLNNDKLPNNNLSKCKINSENDNIISESQQNMMTAKEQMNKSIIKSPSLSSINDSKIHNSLDESSLLNNFVNDINSNSQLINNDVMNKSLNINLDSINNTFNDDKINNVNDNQSIVELKRDNLKDDDGEISNKLNVCIEISDMRDLTNTRIESEKNDQEEDKDVGNISYMTQNSEQIKKMQNDEF